LAQLQVEIVKHFVPGGIALQQPLPLGPVLVESLLELQAAGKQADLGRAERVLGRLAGYCGEPNS
jgi:hypothetical protein